MQVRVFESPDMASGLQMIKKELGPDALILSTRTVRNGKLGVIGKPMLEITAAVDPDYTAEKSETSTILNTSTPSKKPKNTSRKPPSGNRGNFRMVVDDPVNKHLHVEPNHDTRDMDIPKSETTATDFTGKVNEPIKSEVQELKELVANLTSQIQDLAIEKTPRKNNTSRLQVENLDHANELGSSQLQGDSILSLLIKKGIEVETARTIAGFLRESHTELELADSDSLYVAIAKTLENLIEVSPPQFDSTSSQTRIALVGPTGVGKTTTIAKICASFLSKISKSVALITIDTYRIAAVEQLKVYGDIMHIPVDVVITPKQLEDALERHKDKDLILIDTAGRSPLDSYRIEELASFLKPDLNIDIHLVLSATNRENELIETLRRFDTLGLCNTIFTKVDECSNLGVLLNIQLQNPTPLSYVANGQRVPEDLIEVTPKSVAHLILNNDQGAMYG